MIHEIKKTPSYYRVDNVLDSCKLILELAQRADGESPYWMRVLETIKTVQDDMQDDRDLARINERKAARAADADAMSLRDQLERGE